jgi:hypothetical protein
VARPPVSRRLVALTGRALVVTLAAAIAGCVSQSSRPTDSTAVTSSQPSPQPSTGEWRSLMSADAWRGYKESALPSGWQVVNGELRKQEPINDIITKDQYGDFELEFDWKIAKAGNAGVFYRGTEEFEKIYWSAPEYQLLDDAAHADAGDRRTAAGANYALHPSTAGVVKPAGEWNSGRIVARGGHVEHWLNGQKVVEYELWSPDWESKVKAAKFNEWPKYGRARRGYIAIQGDHEGALSLRNVRIREIT